MLLVVVSISPSGCCNIILHLFNQKDSQSQSLSQAILSTERLLLIINPTKSLQCYFSIIYSIYEHLELAFILNFSVLICFIKLLMWLSFVLVVCFFKYFYLALFFSFSFNNFSTSTYKLIYCSCHNASNFHLSCLSCSSNYYIFISALFQLMKIVF